MKKIVEYFVGNSFLVNLLAGFIVVVGILTALSIKRDLHPPFEWNRVTVDIVLPGATPKEVEKFLTYPIEEALKGLRGVEKITSRSSSGNSRVDLYYFTSHAQMGEAPEIVRSKIDAIRSQLPENIRSIQVQRSRTNDIFLYWLGIQGFNEESDEHRHFLLKSERLFLEIPGISKVDRGDRKRDIYIEFDPQKLAKYEISILEARRTIESSLAFVPIGEARVENSRISVEIKKITDSIDKISEIPLTGNSIGRKILLKDVAKVGFKLSEETSIEHVNGQKGTSIILRKDLNTDTVDMKHKVNDIIDKLNTLAPDGVKIVSMMDGAHFVERQLDVLIKNGLFGALFVGLILMLFLNWKTSVMTTLGLPVAYFGTLIFLSIMDMNLDLITLIGLILVVGILVDDAIIVSEKYSEHLTMGLSPQKAASQAVLDLIVPVSGSILTTIVAFSPLILIKSEIATLLAAVPLIVISSLLISWFESFFILPNHLAHFVKTPIKKEKSIFENVRRVYEMLLFHVLRFRYVAIIATLVLIGISGYIGVNKLKHDFNLRIDSERLSLYIVMKNNSTVQETQKRILPLEEFFGRFPTHKIENISTSIGSVWMNGKMHEGAKYAKINAYLFRDEKHPTKLKQELKSQIEEYIQTLDRSDFDKLYVEVEAGEQGEGKKNMVSVRVKGRDDFDYIDIEESILKASQGVQGIQEFVRNPDLYQQSWEFIAEPTKLVEYGLTTSGVATAVRGYFTDDQFSQIRLNGEEVSVHLTYLKDKVPDFSELSQLAVVTERGASVPLKFLGNWQQKDSLKILEHHNGQRNFVLDFKLKDKGVSAEVVKRDLKASLETLSKKFPGHTIEVIDGDENETKNRFWALKVALICIVSVLFVIAMVLKSLTQPLIVGLPIPFGLVGIFFSLYFHNLPLGLMALIGLIGVVGVSVNASIVMMDQINKATRDLGKTLTRGVLIKGASSRLRAILLTTLTTLGGVFPMAYSFGGESGFTQPLAFSMGWGLTSSTLLTLFMLPAFIEVREDILRVLRWRPRSFRNQVASTQKSSVRLDWESDKNPLVIDDSIGENRQKTLDL